MEEVAKEVSKKREWSLDAVFPFLISSQPRIAMFCSVLRSVTQGLTKEEHRVQVRSEL